MHALGALAERDECTLVLLIRARLRASRWSGRLCMHAPVREGAVWCELVEPGELSVPCLWSQSSCLPQRTSSLRASGLSPSGGPRAAPSAESTRRRPLGPPSGPSTLSASYELRLRNRPRLSPPRWLAARPEQAQEMGHACRCTKTGPGKAIPTKWYTFSLFQSQDLRENVRHRALQDKGPRVLVAARAHLPDEG